MVVNYSQFTKFELICRVKELEVLLIDLRDKYEEIFKEYFGETDEFIESTFAEMMINNTLFKGKIVDGKLSIERELGLKDD
ncbi:hypothetical protein CRV08_08575 [Halarcobacter ebronensis]|uniref:Uncharacterized protein n=1 Tax=Halarcobacter ebronensis TaxID=1462615 RepID=A0A4Q0YE20_9BACT|nr:hypothetical protein [Halarcobacter ebronensis]RXJ68295.1 hypothetical protein CRV08_08575 [Halarcobacter ebronensis]